ncbi:hypothetical protein OG874_28770 [Nocardia sp. NBC_00565]|uniref:hypothetical protein n=1 Tax=Nocardia sp. NBC_00565 TaxID=2975993 RepID=UPI002E810F8C|nr:hypothetical protein [Nocardia sp. NBC_00565]WUC00817.1 hypothetical protein OG874_28770 [Nocardia sp. NBC_00565]
MTSPRSWPTRVVPGCRWSHSRPATEPYLLYVLGLGLPHLADAVKARRSEVVDATLHFPIGDLPGPAAAMVHLTEVVAHAVDIAVAIDRPDLADDELCAELLTTMHAQGGLASFRKPGVFDEEVAVPADAPAHRRLLGYLGRSC